MKHFKAYSSENRIKKRPPALAVVMVLLWASCAMAGAEPDWSSMQREMNALEQQKVWIGKAALFDRVKERGNQGNLVARVALCGAYLDKDSPFHDPRVGAVLARDVARELRERADRGQPEALYVLADFYRSGWGVEQDEDLALDLLRRAADAGLAKAQADLGGRYQYGQGVKEDIAEAERYLAQALMSGDPEACFVAAFAYGDPWLSVRIKDKDKALHAYTVAAENGHAFSASILETLYRQGEKVPQSSERAAYWKRKAAELGWSASAYELAEEALERGEAEAAASWYKVAAEGGWDLACDKLAGMYESGQGVDPDLSAAAQWREKAETLRRVEAMDSGSAHDGEAEEGADYELSSLEEMEYLRSMALAGDKLAIQRLRDSLGSLGRRLFMDLLMRAYEQGGVFPGEFNAVSSGPTLSEKPWAADLFELVGPGVSVETSREPFGVPVLRAKGDLPWQLIIYNGGLAIFHDLQDRISGLPAGRGQSPELSLQPSPGPYESAPDIPAPAMDAGGGVYEIPDMPD